MKNRGSIFKVCIVTVSIVCNLYFPVFASGNLVKKEEQKSSVQEYDPEFPLRGKLEELGLEMVYAPWIQSTVYYWSDTYQSYLNNGVIPSDVYMEKCLSEKTLRYFNMPTDKDSICAIAKLADLKDTVFPYSDKKRADALVKNMVRFFKTFPDWREAGEYEKAVHIVNWIRLAEYDEKADFASTPYGCLVEKKASESGYVNTAKLLGVCLGINVMGSENTKGQEYPVFEIDGVWMGYDFITDPQCFTVHNVYTYSEKNEALGSNLYDTYIEDQYFRSMEYEVPLSLNGKFEKTDIIWIKKNNVAQDGLLLHDCCGFFNGKFYDESTRNIK